MTAATIAATDRSDMLGAIATLPDQLRDSYESARAHTDAIRRTWPGGFEHPAPRTLVVCGMGGSGVGADLLAAVSESRAPIVAVKGYDLPAWISDEDRVVCVSYSGGTAETLACFDQAMDRSVMAAVITGGGELERRATDNDIPVVPVPSGFQPRAAVGLLLGALTAVAETLGVVPHGEQLVHEAAKGAQVVIDLHTDTNGALPALDFARELRDHTVIVYGSGATAAIAQRWKCQINENGKLPSWANTYPELDHNELVGWEHAPATGGRFAIVELHGPHDRPENRERMRVTSELISSEVDRAIRIEATQTHTAAAAFELLVWGDYLSVYLALDRGIDPTPVDRIAALKDALAKFG